MESVTIQKAKAGDVDALTELINGNKELAFNIALRITNSTEDAEDIVQDSFLRVLKNLDQFKEEAKFSSWLFKIVYNEALMHRRKQKRSMEFLDSSFIEPTYEENESHLPEDKKLYEAIDKLSINERIIIDLFYLGGKSVKDIRNITGMSSSNIKVILHRARLKLQKILKNE